ncbi:MAG: 23S rRNA (uracil(1939)-C(5))-methyltransferase RlmD [Candidatus Limiplasma sp.]|nr:23S rRNA (uracil(1939)-C(5))-methyltransferase RlmD [Candidatus Limiplasma sp.]
MIEKNQSLTLDCVRLGAELEGVCHHEGQTVFVDGALPGERLEAKALKVTPRYAFAKLLSLESRSPQRREPFCPVYGQCGGCSGQHMSYEATLEAKRQNILDALTRIGGLELEAEQVPPVLGAQNPLHGRNKTSLPVGGTAQDPVLGFYRKRSHRIVSIEDCPVTMEGVAPVIQAVKAWMRRGGVTPYDEESHQGLLRHVVIRRTRRGEMMVLLVSTRPKLPELPFLIDRLTAQAPGFCALHLSVNATLGNVILGDSCQKLYGQDFLVEELLGLDFEISPLSFFQVNPAQTERLYQQALDFAALAPGDVVVDAYAGAGTIALCMARQAKRVIGIEVVPQAVESAWRNARRNGLDNVDFYAAAVEDKLPALVEEGLRPDVVVLDPPRKGVESAVIQAVLKAAPRRVVYVSCHVPTQARDLALLAQGGYRFEACQGVDMFCYASGVENVCVMARGEEAFKGAAPDPA